MARKKSVQLAAKRFCENADDIIAFGKTARQGNLKDEFVSWAYDYAVIKLYREFEWTWVCPVFADSLLLGHSTSSQPNFFVLRGAEMSQCGVSSPGVVKALDILEDRRPHHLSVGP